MKIDRSLDLLKSKQHSLTEIAYICGFSDQSHFTRVFKSISGYLPKEYTKV
ncbi:helix-turn-helix domain-containing protein [Aquimarina algiphila]|uniref:helix-turn-helix domain-containing protein n=1 Tax=Aquimarina algiphila TaxID=2047982 RepID=UPI0038B3A566